jgi:hypothetical protein
MLSIKKCQAILAVNGKNYSDEEVKTIREFLYGIGQNENVHLKEANKDETSGDLHPSFHRRTG